MDGGACGIIVIVVENGHGDQSSNHGQGCSISRSANCNIAIHEYGYAKRI